ncbi:hypothetical protein LTR53_003419 [Teratosphaeriaceae sp. CCFEE 6253]|nr:hypothetical protein LTR53_003419 [Teratosphaeriaceae sp. CCFEE 6253]
MTSLPPDSHTARRLEHSTHEHLHATARRTFIGPIPEGWLKSHRKQWYKRYIGSGGDRTPTWTAAAVSRPMPGASLLSVPGPTSAVTSTEPTPRPSSQSADVGGGDTAASTTSLLRAARSEYEDARTTQTDGSAPLQQRPSDSILRPDRFAKQATATVQKVRFSDSTKQQIRQRARRLASRSSLTWSKVKDGEVLKMDRMLVRIDVTRQTLGPDFDEKVSAGVVTKPLDKWREFMVVCRRQKEDDAESVLQLYQTRVIAASAAEVGKSKKKPKVQIPLAQRRAHVNLFSSLDKTLCVWTSDGSQTTIYYLRPQSGAAAVDWYTFLRGVLGFKRARTLQINVPDLSVSLRLDDPFRTAEASKLLSDAAEGNEDAMTRALNAEKGAAGDIIGRCIGMLEESPAWKDILKSWSQHDRIGLAWKRYDRLEWVYGAVEQRMYGTIAMAKTHDLELRPKNHYPLKTRTREGEMLEEPSPVEGFLIRLTSQKGHIRRMGKMLYKRLYFASYNEYLFFSRPANATPPPPPKMKVAQNGHIPSSKQLAEELPLNYDVDPYPLSDNHITWLDGPKSSSTQRGHDHEAAAEADRNVQMLINSDGFINLCDVRKVRRMQRGAVPADENLDSGSDVDFNPPDASELGAANPSKQDDGTTTEVDDARTLELLMTNGLIIRLQAYDAAARQTWMTRLRALVKYWKARVKADMDLYKTVRQQNLAALQIDERAEAHVGSFATKWEVAQSVASPALYHLCGIAQCRTIHLAGLLYRKPRRRATFTRCYVVLSHGHLMIFRDTLRKGNGARLEHIHHERVGSVDLRGCYLYSGLLTEEELLSRNQTFDSNAPGSHALPRVYLEDGWTSTDEDAMTTFVLWHAKSKAWFRSSQTVDDVRAAAAGGEGVKTKRKLTRVSQLGTTGRSVVFKARSRAERDHWVMGLQVEIERVGAQEAEEKGEEVRLVGDDGGL